MRMPNALGHLWKEKPPPSQVLIRLCFCNCQHLEAICRRLQAAGAEGAEGRRQPLEGQGSPAAEEHLGQGLLLAPL